MIFKEHLSEHIDVLRTPQGAVFKDMTYGEHLIMNLRLVPITFRHIGFLHCIVHFIHGFLPFAWTHGE
jgi:hypothetical protein